MNPFLPWRKYLYYYSLVKEAYSNPPGTKPIFLFDFISYKKLFGSGDSNPQPLNIRPTYGRSIAILDPTETKSFPIGTSGSFIMK